MTATSRDELVPAGTRWTRVEHRDVVDSTNRVVADAARQGATPGLVVVADHQTAGRGRHGRSWEDEPGGSLLVSALVDGTCFEPNLTPLATGLALHDALGTLGADAEMKWPNDVLLDGAKAAGILVESVAAAKEPAGEPAGVLLVVGAGVNVDWRDREHEADRTSIAESIGKAVDPFALLTRFLAALDSRLDEAQHAPDGLRAAYRATCATLGRDVRVVTPSGQLEGRAEDVNECGALVVRGADGRTRVVEAGDVTYVRPAS